MTTQHPTPTDGGTDELPRTYGLDRDAGTVVDAFDEFEPGDKILWGDRTIPCTVARVVTPHDRVGQAITASVLSHDPTKSTTGGVDLERGDVFINPDSWGTLRGRTFVLIQGPRGGFYAICEPERGKSLPALFRAVRTFHAAAHGQPGQGAWKYNEKFDDELTLVEHGDAPEELDPEGDLPAYDDIRDARVMAYLKDEQEHVVVGAYDDVFDEGLHDAHKRIRDEAEIDAQIDELEDDEEDDPVPPAERWEGTPGGNTHSHSTIDVTAVTDTKYGLKAVLHGPAPWETPDGERPMNEVLKETPWDQNHRAFDPGRKAWTVDASELVKVASVLKEAGYTVVDER